MAQCTALEGIARGCDTNIGGIRGVWIWDIQDQTSYTVDTNTNLMSALAVGTSANLESFEFTRESSNYTEDGANDFVNGSTVVTQTINLMFSRRTAAKSKALKILGAGQRFLGGLVLDENGLYWVFQDLQLSTLGEGSGQAKEDGSKYSVVLVAKTASLVPGITGPSALSFITSGTA